MITLLIVAAIGMNEYLGNLCHMKYRVRQKMCTHFNERNLYFVC
jgi:polysaccharide deacetylase 2 family uncharacterized protein YibQ